MTWCDLCVCLFSVCMRVVVRVSVRMRVRAHVCVFAYLCVLHANALQNMFVSSPLCGRVIACLGVYVWKHDSVHVPFPCAIAVGDLHGSIVDMFAMLL